MPNGHHQHADEKLEKLRRSKSQQYKMEATGILLLGILILVVTFLRYWRHILWGVH